MVNLKCITAAVEEGMLTEAQARKINHDVESFIRQNTNDPSLTGAQVIEEALKSAAKQIRQDVGLRKMRALLQTKQHMALEAYLRNSDNIPGAIDGIFARDFSDANNLAFTNVQYRYEHLNTRAIGRMREGLNRAQRNFKGNINKTTQELAYREITGVDTGDDLAKQIAKEITDAMGWINQQFRKAGGVIHKIEDFDVPHVHSMEKIRRVTREEWINFTAPKLDRAKMLTKDGSAPMDDAELEKFLDAAYDTLASGGNNKNLDGRNVPGQVMNKYDRERLLHFKADKWQEYNESFGKAYLIGTVLQRVDELSRSTAMMDTFGPDVRAGIGHVEAVAKDVLDKRIEKAVRQTKKHSHLAKQRDEIARNVNNWNKVADNNVWDEFESGWARGHANTRDMIGAAKLGSAIVAAVGDFGTHMMAAKHNNIPFIRSMKTYFENIIKTKGTAEFEELLGEIGVLTDHLVQNTLVASRYTVDEFDTFGRTFMDKTMKWSGLQRHTEVGRMAFAYTAAREIADQSSKSFDYLPKGFRRGLERNGITPDDWVKIQASDWKQYKGQNVLDLNQYDRDLSDKLFQWIRSETDVAVLHGNSWATDKLVVDSGLTGQAGKYFYQLKRFPILMYQSHIKRMMSRRLSGGEKTAYAMGTILTLWSLGAVAQTAHDLLNGRDPRWEDPLFWTDAFLKGGAGGLFADGISQVMREVDGSGNPDYVAALAKMLVGPVGGLAKDVLEVPMKPVVNAVRGDDLTEGVGKEAADLINWLPGQNLLPLRLTGSDRWLKDNLRRLIDPDAQDYFDRLNYYADRDEVEHWWSPGDVLPDRAPME